MAQETLLIQPETLLIQVKECTQQALECGVLQPIETEYELVEQEGIPFLVRTLTNLARKHKEQKKQEKADKSFNPFLPYDEALFIADISKTHLCLLNKYNVLDHHLLIVTREFEDQENWLNLRDFEAMWAVLAQVDGLAFYNGGKGAGASQPHKHLQVVPLPLVPDIERLPISPAIAATDFQDNIGISPKLPFIHAIAKLDPNWAECPSQAAQNTLELYYHLLCKVGLLGQEVPCEKQSQPYNLLATRDWMMIVPRSQEKFQGISINSLGFAGALLAKNEEEKQLIQEHSPMNILKSVAQS